MAAVERMGLDADIVHSAQVDESKEGVAECIVFSFEFRATKNKRRIKIKRCTSYCLIYFPIYP